MNLGCFVPTSTFNDLIANFTTEQQIEFNYYEILGTISRKLVEYRIKHNLNQKQLSERLGVAQSMVSKYESGDYNISIKALNELCGKLGFMLDVNITIPETSEIADSPDVSAMNSLFADDYSLAA